MEQLQLLEGKYLVWRLDKIEQEELAKALARFQLRFNGRPLAAIHCRRQQVDQLRDKLQLPAGIELKGRTTIQPNHIWLT